MLKLTKTGIGLLTRQYRSVLKKCPLLNLGLFAIFTSSSANALLRLYTPQKVTNLNIPSEQIYYLSSFVSDDNYGAVFSWVEVRDMVGGKQDALSSTQLAAANSGITAAKVSTYDGYSTTIAKKANLSGAAFTGNVSIADAKTFKVGTGATTLGGTLGVTGLATFSATNGLRFGTASGTLVAKSIYGRNHTAHQIIAHSEKKSIRITNVR